MAHRYKRVEWGVFGTRQLTSAQAWRAVNSLNEYAAEVGQIKTVFCASLADIFESWGGQLRGPGKRPLWIKSANLDPRTCRPDVSIDGVAGDRPLTLDGALRSVLEMSARMRNLYFLMLTKRPELIRDRLAESAGWALLPRNCIAGTSVSDQETAEQYCGALRDMKEQGVCGPVFVSYEPAIGPVRWKSLKLRDWCDWLIVGGESGDALHYPRNPQSRPCAQRWLRDAVDVCRAEGVPVFVKQLGELSIDERGRRIVYRDPKGGNPDEWPEHFRIRERLVQVDGTLLRSTL